MKTRSAFKSAQWHAGAPDHVTAQVLWQIAVNGYEHTHYAVLGPQGSQGAAGPQGDTGAQGAQGFQGGTGAQGPQGFQGGTGAQGAQGPVGVSGYDVNTTETTCSPGASCVTLVECDPGKVVTGGGVVWEPFVFGVTVNQSGAFADRTGWQAGVQNAADVPVTYEAQAICVNAS